MVEACSTGGLRLRHVTRLLPAVLLAFALCLATSEANAQYLIREVRGGVLWHDTPDLWSGFQLEKNSVDLNAELVFAPGLPFLFGMIRPVVGGSVSTGGQTSHAYIDARWEIEGPAGLFLGLGVGAAVHDGQTLPDRIDRKALGSRALFHIPFEVGVRFAHHSSLSVYFEHTSNANTQRHNEGMDRIGVRYGYRF